MTFMNWILGEGAKTQQFQRFTEPQQETLDEILGGARAGIDPMLHFPNFIFHQHLESSGDSFTCSGS